MFNGFLNIFAGIHLKRHQFSGLDLSEAFYSKLLSWTYNLVEMCAIA